MQIQSFIYNSRFSTWLDVSSVRQCSNKFDTAFTDSKHSRSAKPQTPFGLCPRLTKTFRKGLIFIQVIFVSVIASQAQNVYHITDFGAKGDGLTMNTRAIQAAIDTCSRYGGQVVIPAGCFLTGTIFLKSNVELHLCLTAVLKGSPNFSDYPALIGNRGALIFASEQENISITGKGVIDGNGGHPNFQSGDKYNGLPNRPHPIGLVKSSNVKIKEVTVKDGAFWNIMLEQCTYVTVDDVQVKSRIIANNDGLDLVDCHNTMVSNCFFDTGDDAICPKSHSAFGVKNLTITNCIVKSESNGIKFGTRGDGGFQNVTISNCVIYDTRLSGVTLQMVDGGIMDRITINNITMQNVNGGIFLKLGARRGDKPGVLKNVLISNVVADGIGCWKADTTAAYFKIEHDRRIGMSIVGQPGYRVENVVFDNIYLQFAGGEISGNAPADLTDKPSAYPEYTNFGITPAYGINCLQVNNIVFRNIKVEFIEEDYRPAFYINHSSGITIDHFQAKVSEHARSVIRMKNVENAFIFNCKPKAEIPFLSLEEKIRDVSLLNNDFSNLDKVITSESRYLLKEVKGIEKNILK